MVILAGLGAFLGRLGAILEPLERNMSRFGRPRGPKREPKRHPKRDQNDIKILIDFWIDFGAILGPQERHPPKGGGGNPAQGDPP